MNKQKKVTLFLLLVIALAAGSFSQLRAGDPPQPLTPINSSTCNSITPYFSWSSDPTATSYRLIISTDVNFNSIVLDSTGIVTSNVTKTMPTYNTDYYWKVEATFNDNSKATSSVKNFRTKPQYPTPASPANGYGCQPQTVNLSWSAVNGTVNYRLQLAEDAAFATVILDKADLTTTSTATLVDKFNHTYYWRVMSMQANDCSTDWSPVFSFTTQNAPPVKVAPADAASGRPLIDTLRWTSTTKPDSYRLEVAPDNLFATGVQAFNNLTDTFQVVNLTQYNHIYYWRVKANYAGCETGWTAVTNFRTKYEPPVLSLPKDTTDCVPLTSNFIWLASSGASTYRIQMSIHSNFDTLEVNRATISGTNAIITLKSGLTKYYWRVRAEDGANLSDWSTPFWFRTTPVYPTRISPPDSSVAQPLTIRLLWHKVTDNLSTYNLHISTLANGKDTVLIVKDIHDTAYTATLTQYYKNYYWRLQTNHDGCFSDWSPFWTFRTILQPPTLLYPGDTTTRLPLVIDFRWVAPAGAETYEFNLSKESDFKTLVVGQLGIDNNDFLIRNLQPSTTYYWRVNASNKEGTSAWSSTFKFTTGVQGPQVPQLVWPEDKSVKQPIDMTFRWRQSARAVSYHLQVSKVSTFATTVIDNNTLTDTLLMAQLDNYTNYYWRVSATNDSGATNWSQVRTFRTIALAPDEIPQLSVPVNNAEDVPVDLTFRWNPVTRAEEYIFQLSRQSDFSTLERNERTSSPMYYVSGMNTETTYYWRVIAQNEAGQSPWSQVRQFRTSKFVSVNEPMVQKFSLTATPNPFGVETRINFVLPEASNVELRIFNALGEEVAMPANGFMEAGQHSVNWNASELGSGVYMATLKIGSEKVTFNLVVAK